MSSLSSATTISARAAAAPAAGFGDSGGGSSLGCAIGRSGRGSGPAGWLVLLGLIGVPGMLRRRRRR